MKASTLVCLLALAVHFPLAAAEECPSPSAEDRVLRRGLAKEWFMKGEAASKAGADVSAIKSFQCSMSLIPHGFTAYNLGQVAERTGDLELAITSYERYTQLMPQAEDVPEVRKKLVLLKDRLAKVQESVQVDLASVKKSDSSNSDGMPADPPAVKRPERVVVAKPVAEKSAPEVDSGGFGTAAWVTLGAGVAMLGTGVVLNVMARKKMTTSDQLYDDGNRTGAESAQSTAKAYAYSSYALMGVGALATAAGVTLGLLPKSGEAKVEVASGGGLTFALGGRF